MFCRAIPHYKKTIKILAINHLKELRMFIGIVFGVIGIFFLIIAYRWFYIQYLGGLIDIETNWDVAQAAI